MVKSIDQLQDFKGTLEELSRIVNFLKEDYGGDSLIWLGTNVIVETKDKIYG